jgi:hypothetical protein
MNCIYCWFILPTFSLFIWHKIMGINISIHTQTKKETKIFHVQWKCLIPNSCSFSKVFWIEVVAKNEECSQSISLPYFALYILQLKFCWLLTVPSHSLPIILNFSDGEVYNFVLKYHTICLKFG